MNTIFYRVSFTSSVLSDLSQYDTIKKAREAIKANAAVCERYNCLSYRYTITEWTSKTIEDNIVLAKP